MTPDEIERRLRAVPRLAHDDGDYVVPDYAALARLVAAMLQEEREACACGAARDCLRALLVEREAEIAEYEALHALARRREQLWIERWQRETGKVDTLPDYGEILAWMMDKAARAEATLAHAAEVKAMLNACDVRDRWPQCDDRCDEICSIHRPSAPEGRGCESE